MIPFIVGLFIGACVAALAIILCETNDKTMGRCPEDDKCCYFCNMANDCPHACKSNPNECSKEVNYESH